MGLLLSAPPPEELKRAAAEILTESHIQTEFPGTQPDGKRSPSARKAEQADKRAERRTEGRTDGRGSTALEMVLWTLIAAALAVLGVYVARRLSGYDANLSLGGGAGPAGATIRAPPPLDAAEQLASEGRFAEAIHTLLLLALHPLSQEEHLAGSLTSREILRTVDLPEAADRAVAGLVRAVELTVFGGRPSGRADYDAAADHYRTFQRVLGQAGA